MTMPQVATPNDDELAAIRAQFAEVGVTPDNVGDLINQATPTEQPPPKRGRGRPKGSRNKPHPRDYEPYQTSDSEDIPTLTTPKLTTRDQREVSDRLAGILTGITGVASVAKPYLQMTDEEAQAIAIPLSTYLLRTEATSKTARQVLEEYDIAAFVIALAAYAVRVFMDYRTEREMNAANSSKREPEPKNITPISEPRFQSQNGEERPASREFASTSEGGWLPSQV